jgi:hypothetical protein
MSIVRVIDSENLGDFMADFVNEETQTTAFFIDTALVYQTPKDTTQAARSWNASLVSEDNSLVDHGTIGAAVSNGTAEIQRSQPYKKIFIQNMQPYIGRLNSGWSLQQRNPGYIERIILQAANR